MKRENCSIFVVGMEVNCPLCGILVKSGVAHECEKVKQKIRKPTRKLATKTSEKQ